MKRQKGFTLIELMIVVAIIGILASIAVPKFVDLVNKAKDAATYGNLGAMRSAIVLFYADSEKWPNEDGATTLTAAITPENIARIPATKLGNLAGCVENAVVLEVSNGTAGYDLTTAVTGATGGWLYNQKTGEIIINCANLEAKTKAPERYCDK